MLERLGYYAPYAWRFCATRTAGPLILGLAITDRCNLACRECHVSNTGRPDMTWGEICERLDSAYERGCREVYFSGGEPTLWSDATHTLDDAIAQARRVGYFHVHVYTNGLLGIPSSADMVWVSMDGLPGVFELRRGDHFFEVERAVRDTPHPATALIYVIDRNTASGIEPFLHWVRGTKLPVIGVMVYFHTPYYGYDELYLNAEERAPIIDELLALKRKRLPLMNSHAGLQALKRGDWERRMPVALVADVDGESVCCRAADSVCPDCGYAACTELHQARRLRPSAVMGMVRYV